jgi:hypothetical protein
VYVFDSDEGGGAWYIVGGTSVSSPALAGIVNAAQSRFSQATTKAGGYYQPGELTYLYAEYGSPKFYGSYFYDVTTGSNGHAAGTGYDQCTGLGSPRGRNGK